MDRIQPTRSASLDVALVTSAVAAWSLARIAQELAAIGVRGVEPTIGPDGHLAAGDPHGAAVAGRLLRAAGLRVCCVAATTALPLGAPALASALEIAGGLGAPMLRVFAAPVRDGMTVGSQRDAAAERLAELRERAGGRIAIVLEPAPGTLAATPAAAAALARRAGAGIVFDPASLLGDGYLEPARALAALDGLVRHVHVKNRVRAGAGGVARPSELAAGDVDWTDAMQQLARAGYTGWLSIDHLSAPPAAAVLQRDVAALRRLVAGTVKSVPRRLP